MNISRRMSRISGVLCLALFFTVPAAADRDLPQSTHDGLVLKRHDEHGAVYVKEGASLADYDKAAVSDVVISFKKNWQRDHNRDIRALANKVTDQDILKIKEGMAERFYPVFESALNDNGWPTTNAAASDVLLIQPSIVNLDIYAPSVNPAGRNDTYVAEAGEMTLILELYDSVTSDILARAVDAQLVGENQLAHLSTQSANIAAYEAELKGWATRLVNALNNAKQATAQ